MLKLAGGSTTGLSNRVRQYVAVAAIATAAVVAGCDTTEPLVCTQRGCVDHGLTVQLASTPTSAFRIDVRSQGSATVYVYDCPDPARCTSHPFFPDFLPQQVEVTVTTGRGTVRQNAIPVYTTSRPNGEQCEPLCRRAAVTVSIPP
jgi:hypothetical protein